MHCCPPPPPDTMLELEKLLAHVSNIVGGVRGRAEQV